MTDVTKPNIVLYLALQFLCMSSVRIFFVVGLHLAATIVAVVHNMASLRLLFVFIPHFIWTAVIYVFLLFN